MSCEHEWMTVFSDCSGNGGMNDFLETIQGYYDAYVYYRCKVCDKRENEQCVKAYPSRVGYGDYETSGRLDLTAFAKVLNSRKSAFSSQ